MNSTRPGVGSLVLLRHGESTANAAGTFTGVLDVELTSRGVSETHTAAALLDAAALQPDAVFTSALGRTITTARIVLDDLGSAVVPHPDWRLNERNYGALTGRSKADERSAHGGGQLHRWRRSIDDAPPPLSDAQFHELKHQAAFTSLPAEALTRTENLRDVILRVTGFTDDELRPELLLGRTVLVVGHGNSLRALCAVLDHLTDAEVERLNIPTGQPLVYRFTSELSPTPPGGRYLAPEAASAASEILASQGGT